MRSSSDKRGVLFDQPTFRFPTEFLDLLGAWHELGVYIELAASPGDEVTVLQMSFSLASRNVRQTHLRAKV